MSKFFATLCTIHGELYLTIPAYHPPNECTGQTEQSYQSHTTAALHCQNPNRLGYIGAAINVLVQHVKTQVHKHDSF